MSDPLSAERIAQIRDTPWTYAKRPWLIRALKDMSEEVARLLSAQDEIQEVKRQLTIELEESRSTFAALAEHHAATELAWNRDRAEVSRLSVALQHVHIAIRGINE